MKKIFVVGSTGSIGCQTLDVIRAYREQFEVVGLCAFGNQTERLCEQAKEFAPQTVGIYDESKRDSDCVKTLVQTGVQRDKKVRLCFGQEALTCVADTDAELVVVACSGMIALHAVVAALRAKKNVALANKECIVACGTAVLSLAKRQGVTIVPIDSEHSAIAQCLRVEKDKARLSRILLTASGGAYYECTREQLEKVTVQDALKHPTWQMGNKITVDSATMVNKALEIIEAKHFFETDKIDYCIHPQSIIHSMVEYNDGSIIANLSNPSMKIPIMLAIADARQPVGARRLDFDALGGLRFLPKNESVFVAPLLAKQLIQKDNLYPCVFNTANEVAVQKFLSGQIAFVDIVPFVQNALQMDFGMNLASTPTIETAFACDQGVRERLVR
ncbi:MAG: 1-deoxy-D-xylulose-5-phosphate reductoisomerase [Firmicutes bacterium]|nr:1-deoxy-D-xylulose-5-phosphate reductoisomerase [Bacillota bacterium]